MALIILEQVIFMYLCTNLQLKYLIPQDTIEIVQYTPSQAATDNPHISDSVQVYNNIFIPTTGLFLTVLIKRWKPNSLDSTFPQHD